MKTALNKSVCIIIALLVLMSACLCGCEENVKGFTLPLSPDNKSAFEMCTTMYTETKLNEIYKKAVDTEYAADLDKSFPLQCLRKDGDNFNVYFVSANEILILAYDQNGKLIEQSKKKDLRRLLNTLYMLEELEVGDNVHEVQAIDQHSYIPFMAGEENAPMSSDHYTEDGYHMHIEYDGNRNIVSIDTGII